MAKKNDEKIKLEFKPQETGLAAVGRTFASRLRGEHIKHDPEAEELERLRELCRNGNPFPLIAFQWPNLVLTEPDEIAAFAKYLTPEKFDSVTDGVRAACLDPSNPPLRLDWWQMLTIAAYFDVTITEICSKGATGVGKNGSTAIATCLWFDVYEDSRITLTGRDKEHAVKNVFGETKNWFAKMAHPQPARVLGESIIRNERHYIDILNPDPSSPTAGEAFSGAHGGHTLYIFDENTSHPSSFVENAVRNAKKIACLGNPRHRLGPFYQAFEKMGIDRIDEIGMCYGRQGMRLNVTIGGLDCINVAEGRLKDQVAPEGGMEVNGKVYKEGEKVPDDEYKPLKFLIPGQMDLIQFRARLLEPMPECYAHGKFPKEDAEKQLILPSWLPRHEDAWNDGIAVTCVGGDIARSLNGDRSVFAFGGEHGCRAIHQLQLNDVIKIAEELITLSRKYNLNLTGGQVPICLDYGGGYGAGVGDYLKTLGVWVIEFQPGGGSQFPRNYANLRAEGYATLGARLDPSGYFGSKTWALPKVAGLREELTAPERIFAPDMVRFRIHPKDEIKKALGRSPDLADAVTYLFHAVRVRYSLDQWLFKIQNRPLILFPIPKAQEQTQEIIERVKEYEKSEFDGVQFEWSPKKPDEERKVVVAKPDKHKREPWYARYLKDD